MKNTKTWDEQLAQCIQLREKDEMFEQNISQLQFDNACEYQQPLIKKEDYIQKKCGYDPKERIRHDYTQPSKIKPLITMAVSIVLAVLGVFLFILGISNSKKSGTLMDLKNNPGQGYEQWVDTWNDFSTFDELSETWYLVENDWKEQGVTVSWEDVLEIKNTYFSYGTIYSDNLLSKLTFEMSNQYSDKAGSCYGWGIGVLIVAAVAFFFVHRGVNSDYKMMLSKYTEECARNAQLANEHTEWEKKVKIHEKKYVEMKKEYNEETKAMNARKEERERQAAEIRAEQEKLNEQIFEAEEGIWEKLREADERVPETKKYGNDLGDLPRTTSDFFKSIRLYLKGEDFVGALLAYYNDWHERDLEAEEERRLEEEERRREREEERRREREEERYRMEKERNRLETERNRLDAERNRIERERTLAYEREQKENRRQQEQLAKKEAEYAAARAQCAQCASFAHCISGKKNKNPYCMNCKRR